MDLAFVEIHFLQFFCKSRVVLFQMQTGYDTIYYYINTVTAQERTASPRLPTAQIVWQTTSPRTQESSWTKESQLFTVMQPLTFF